MPLVSGNNLLQVFSRLRRLLEDFQYVFYVKVNSDPAVDSPGLFRTRNLDIISLSSPEDVREWVTS